MFTLKMIGKIAVCLFCSHLLLNNALAEDSNTIEGVIVDVSGQRITVRDKDNNFTWVSLRVTPGLTIDASLVGKTIRGQTSRIGDAIVVIAPAFSQ
jgi:hypothetical protein